MDLKVEIGRFLSAFIPLFVSIDPLGLIAIFMGMTRDMSQTRRKKIANQAVLTAFIVALGFMAVGQLVFDALGITVADFRVAGGLILLFLASRDLLMHEEAVPLAREEIGIVPLGLPLIAGPATLTALLLLIGQVGLVWTWVALILNLILVNVGFHFGEKIQKLIGKTGMMAVSKIIALLLVAIAVNMIRRGIQSF